MMNWCVERVLGMAPASPRVSDRGKMLAAVRRDGRALEQGLEECGRIMLIMIIIIIIVIIYHYYYYYYYYCYYIISIIVITIVIVIISIITIII